MKKRRMHGLTWITSDGDQWTVTRNGRQYALDYQVTEGWYLSGPGIARWLIGASLEEAASTAATCIR